MILQFENVLRELFKIKVVPIELIGLLCIDLKSDLPEIDYNYRLKMEISTLVSVLRDLGTVRAQDVRFCFSLFRNQLWEINWYMYSDDYSMRWLRSVGGYEVSPDCIVILRSCLSMTSLQTVRTWYSPRLIFTSCFKWRNPDKSHTQFTRNCSRFSRYSRLVRSAVTVVVERSRAGGT